MSPSFLCYLLVIICCLVIADTNLREALRFVSLSESSLDTTDRDGIQIHTEAKNKVHCIQRCLDTDWCKLACFKEDEVCILSRLIVYYNHPGNGEPKLNCYTRMKMNFATAATVVGSPDLLNDNGEIYHSPVDTLVDGISFQTIHKDCYHSRRNSQPLIYLLFDLGEEKPITEVTLRSNLHHGAPFAIIFEKADIYLGKTADISNIESKDFDGFVKIGETVAPTIPAQLHRFQLQEKFFGRYLLIHKTAPAFSLCDIIIS